MEKIMVGAIGHVAFVRDYFTTILGLIHADVGKGVLRD